MRLRACETSIRKQYASSGYDENLLLFIQSNWRPILLFGIAAVLYTVIAPLWIDADGAYWVYLAQNGATHPFKVYTEWSVSPAPPASFEYNFPPLFSWLILGCHQLFKLLSLTGPIITPISFGLFKLIVLTPFAFGTAILLYRLAGPKAAALWLFNPIVVWAVPVSGLEDVLVAFFFALTAYFLVGRRHIHASIALSFALLSKQFVLFVLPFYFFSLFRLDLKKMIKCLVAFLLPQTLNIPYLLLDEKFLGQSSSRGLEAFLPHHLGLVFGGTVIIHAISLNVFAFVIYMFLVSIKRPSFSFNNFISWPLMFLLVWAGFNPMWVWKWVLMLLPLLLLFAVKVSKKSLYLVYSFVHVSFHIIWNAGYFDAEIPGGTLFFGYRIYNWPINPVFLFDILSKDTWILLIKSAFAALNVIFLYYAIKYCLKIRLFHPASRNNLSETNGS